IITTFAVVAGVEGAKLIIGVILVLGVANLLADGISMGIGDYLSTKSEREYQKREREREMWEVENYPEGEKLEMVELYEDKGMKKEDAEAMVDIMSKYKDTWVDIMMVEELGILEDNDSPLNNAIATFLSFLAFGSIPLVSYILALMIPGLSSNKILLFVLAIILTCITLFVLGALKTQFTGKKVLIAGLEMLLVGGGAAAAAYFIGFLLNFLVA
ncbi:hypothetical protein GF325_18615, partial [Candidatus Bathyarchaeota archaeon]|nr:hypothetical protein [Candidatus Bathyarchaeota archaeon]